MDNTDTDPMPALDDPAGVIYRILELAGGIPELAASDDPDRHITAAVRAWRLAAVQHDRAHARFPDPVLYDTLERLATIAIRGFVADAQARAGD